jgi:hypothetical protein
MFDIPKRLIDTSNTTRQSTSRTVSPCQDFEIGGRPERPIIKPEHYSVSTLCVVNYPIHVI